MRFPSFKIILAFVSLAILGLSFLPQLPTKLSPSQFLPQVSVSFSMYGASPIVVETEVTSKLEAMLSRMKGVKGIRSTSELGWGNISIQLDKHTDVDMARFEASTIIRQAWPQLPAEVSYPGVSVSRSDNNSGRPFLNYQIISPEIPFSIQQYAEENIVPYISQIEGVYQVAVSGARPMEWQLEYDYKSLESIGLTTYDIQSAFNRHLRSESLGMTSVTTEQGEERRMRLALASDETLTSEDDLKSIEIKNINGRIVRLGDIVKIARVESQPTGYYRINGQNTVYMSITADEAANQLELGKVVKKRLEELQESLPENYSLRLSYDATKYIDEEMNKIYFRAGLTILILILFIILIYRDIKYVLLIVITLVVNIAVALIFYYGLKLEMQLYSLAGITISLTLIIDNTIIMSDQIIHRGNKKAFLAILTATVTTIGSLIIIFFLDESIRLNLKDFAAVIIINLAISLFIALFLVPALIERMGIGKKKRKDAATIVGKPTITGGESGRKKHRWTFSKRQRRRFPVHFNRIYSATISFLHRFRIIVVILLVLAFGLPVFLLPDKVEDKGILSEFYAKTLGSRTYREHIKPHANKFLGGTWRLFVEKVYSGSYWSNRGGETTLNVTASMPHGTTLAQMNNLIQRMEAYISRYPEVRQFETSIQNANRASISVRFTKENQRNSFPYILRSDLISKATELGGGSWTVHGVGDGFSNDVKEQAGNSRIKMLGFNYDELYAYAEQVVDSIQKDQRSKEASIKAEFSWYKEDFQEYRLNLKKDRLIQEGIQPYQLFAAVRPFFERRIPAGSQLLYDGYNENIILWARQSVDFDIWDLEHIHFLIGGKEIKLSELASIEKHQAPQRIVKENQQYQLCIQYDYVGSYEQGRRKLDRLVEKFQKELLPTGYSIKNENSGYNYWSKKDSKQYWLLGLVFLIIYFCSSILFNSLRQPLLIIFIIPLSFIGLFLTFYWFNLNFDQGGFAAFILLCGLTVNANIYIINEYNNIRKDNPQLSPMAAYLKAWNAKVRPIFLTIVSTILGFIPFVVGFREGFWFPLAAGTMGGLVMSFIVLFFCLPLFMGVGIQRKKRG